MKNTNNMLTASPKKKYLYNNMLESVSVTLFPRPPRLTSSNIQLHNMAAMS